MPDGSVEVSVGTHHDRSAAMISKLPPDLGLLLALRRVKAGHVIMYDSALYTETGGRFPRVYAPYIRELFAHGHVRVEHPDDDAAEQPVLITEPGEAYLAELEAKTASGPTSPVSPRVSRQRPGTPVPGPVETITWFSVNLRSGGTTFIPAAPFLRRHGTRIDDWLMRFPEVVSLSPHRPDVIFVQEAAGFDREGEELLLFVERLLRKSGHGTYRGFLTKSRRCDDHQVVLINTARLEGVHHWRGADPDEPRDRRGWVEVIVNGDDQRLLWLHSVHLNPRNGRARLDDAIDIQGAVAVDQRAMMAGDFNSITSCRTAEDGEPQPDLSALPAAVRYGKGIWPPTKPNGDTGPDTGAVDYLIGTGWVDHASLLNNSTPTTTAEYDPAGPAIYDRCLTRGELEVLSMWVDTSNLPYSDHRALGGRVAIVGSAQQGPHDDHRA